MEFITVGRPHLVTFDSFTRGVQDPLTQERMRQARLDWQITDNMSVRAYSYSTNSLRLNFESVTLEIVADGPNVKWKIEEVMPTLATNLAPYRLVDADSGQERNMFDRDAVVAPLIGQRIRYAPSANELYLIWKPDHEICFQSLPLLGENGWLLYYAP